MVFEANAYGDIISYEDVFVNVLGVNRNSIKYDNDNKLLIAYIEDLPVVALDKNRIMRLKDSLYNRPEDVIEEIESTGAYLRKFVQFMKEFISDLYTFQSLVKAIYPNVDKISFDYNYDMEEDRNTDIIKILNIMNFQYGIRLKNCDTECTILGQLRRTKNGIEIYYSYVCPDGLYVPEKYEKAVYSNEDDFKIHIGYHFRSVIKCCKRFCQGK